MLFTSIPLRVKLPQPLADKGMSPPAWSVDSRGTLNLCIVGWAGVAGESGMDLPEDALRDTCHALLYTYSWLF